MEDIPHRVTYSTRKPNTGHSHGHLPMGVASQQWMAIRIRTETLRAAHTRNEQLDSHQKDCYRNFPVRRILITDSSASCQCIAFREAEMVLQIAQGKVDANRKQPPDLPKWEDPLRLRRRMRLTLPRHSSRIRGSICTSKITKVDGLRYIARFIMAM